MVRVMALNSTLWREIPGRPGYYEYIGPQREPDLEKVRQMIRDAMSTATTSNRSGTEPA